MIVNLYVRGEGPGYRVDVRVDFKDLALKRFTRKCRESNLSREALSYRVNFFFCNLGRHQHGIDCSNFHHSLISVRRLIRVNEPLEYNAVNGRFHPDAFKRDLSLSKAHGCLGERLTRICKANLCFLQIEWRAHILLCES